MGREWPTCEQEWVPFIAVADLCYADGKGKGKGGGKKGKGWKGQGGDKGNKGGGKKGTKGNKGAWKGKGSEKGYGKGKGFQGDCWGCGKWGHSLQNCPDSKENDKDGGVAPVENEVTKRRTSTRK